MKKIINVNLAGRLIPIEDSAYELLRQYLESLKKYFLKEEGGDEIMFDIESRIAEVFQEKLKKGAHCITDEEVISVKTFMGTPEQFDEDAPVTKAEQHADSGEAENSWRPRKRLYRDPENKVLSGVCSGLGAYFNIDPIIFRIIFALVTIGGFGSGILVYFILWIATPAAETAAEKLEMRGEPVNLSNIKATIQDEMNHMKSQLKNTGEEFRNFSMGRGRQMGSSIERFLTNLVKGLGKALVIVTRGFIYFLAVIVLICLIVVGIAITISSAALFPLYNLLLTAPLQSMLFWPALGLLVGIPIVALLIFIVRKLTGVKEFNRYAVYTLIFLWLAGLISTAIIVFSLAKDFRRPATQTESFAMQQPTKGKLVLKRNVGGLLEEANGIAFFDSHLLAADDTVIINFIQIRIEKSPNDSFMVAISRFSRGRTVHQARTLANDIQFNLHQQDSVLYLPEGFSIPAHSKYRGQRVIITIKVPVGKNLEIDREVYRHYIINRHHWKDDWVPDDDQEEPGPLNLKMTPDGLNDLNKHIPATRDSRINTSSYRHQDNYSSSENTATVRHTAAPFNIYKEISFIAYVLINMFHS